MSIVIQQPGGLNRGGLNFDAKVRRESIAPRDLVLAHVGAMDCYALGLRKAVALHEKRARCSACSTNGTCRGVSPQ